MNRVLLLAGLIYFIILTALITLYGGLLVLAVPMLLYLGFGLASGPQKLDLRVERSVDPKRAQPGKLIEIQLNITNLGPQLDELFLQDEVPAGLEIVEGETSVIARLATHKSILIAYCIRGKRGIYRFNKVSASAYSPFKVIRQDRVFQSPGQTFILPESPRLKLVDIRPRQTRVYSGSIPARQGGSGVEFYGVREYQAGDALRHINWKASARHPDFLFTNEFEQERVADVWLILDARIRSDIRTTHGSLFEPAVTATAALAQALLFQGNRVGLLIYGGFLDWTYPGYGKIQREQILRALARARPGVSMVFDRLENLPSRVFPLSSQLMLISPLHDEDLSILLHLRARGYQVIVISPDPIAFEGNSLPNQNEEELGLRLARMERSVLLGQLRNSGVHVFNWDVSVPFERAMGVSFSRLLPWLHSVGLRR